MNKIFHFNLGDMVEDPITGYKGVVVIHLRYLYNQDRYAVRSKELREGKPIDPVTFDATSLKFLEKTDIEVPEFPELLINFGDEVKDKLSDYKGTVVGCGYWINGCIRVGVQSKDLNKDGYPVEELWLPKDQLKVTKKGKSVPVKEDNPGGPMKDPTPMKTPRY